MYEYGVFIYMLNVHIYLVFAYIFGEDLLVHVLLQCMALVSAVDACALVI